MNINYDRWVDEKSAAEYLKVKPYMLPRGVRLRNIKTANK